MKVKLGANAEIDIVSPGELNAALGDMQKRAWKRFDTQVITDPGGPFDLDGAGLAPQGQRVLYKVPMGFTFRMHNFVIADSVGTPQAPTSISIWVYRTQVSGLNLVAVGSISPNVLTRGTLDAPMFRGGQEIIVVVIGPANLKQVALSCQGDLRPVEFPEEPAVPTKK